MSSNPGPGPIPPPPRRPAGAADDDAQAIFDTVTGPNLRKKDNLIQAAVIAGGMVLGALVGAVWLLVAGGDAAAGALVGGFVGVVVSLLLSGFVIGLLRTITAARRR